MDTQGAEALSRDTVASVVRALVLYSLAEFQSGNATAVHVRAEGLAFQVSDDGRGHALDRTVAGQPYMSFVYTHLDFPFARPVAPPVQLHTIGLSLINTLCSQLAVTVRKQGSTLRSTYRDGRHIGDETLSTEKAETGNTIAGTLSPHLQRGGVDVQRLREWLCSVATASPGLALYFNGVLLPSHNAA